MAVGKGEQATGSLAAPQRGENWFLIWGERRGGPGGAGCGRQAWCPVFAPGLSKAALVFLISLHLLSRICACAQLFSPPRGFSVILLLEATRVLVLLLPFLELLLV